MKITRKIFELEKKKINIPVFELTYKNCYKKMVKFCKESKKYIYDFDDTGNTVGLYCNYKKNHFIFIYKDITLKTKLWVLLHERGHYLCNKNKCSCLNKLQRHEEHATIFALKYLLNNNYDEALFDYIINMIALTLNAEESLHARAYSKIIKMKLWQKCCDYLDQNYKKEKLLNKGKNKDGK